MSQVPCHMLLKQGGTTSDQSNVLSTIFVLGIFYSLLWVNTSRLAAEVFPQSGNIWIPGQARDDKTEADTSRLAAG